MTGAHLMTGAAASVCAAVISSDTSSRMMAPPMP